MCSNLYHTFLPRKFIPLVFVCNFGCEDGQRGNQTNRNVGKIQFAGVEILIYSIMRDFRLGMPG